MGHLSFRLGRTRTPGYQEIDIVEDSYWSGYTDMVGKYTLYPQGEDSGKHLNDRVWTQAWEGRDRPHDMDSGEGVLGDLGGAPH